jgi:anaerobic ribonucleoside-triphosphate reductase
MEKENNNQPQNCGAKTEVYSRVVGFYRPVEQWNKGKREEFDDRTTYVVSN